MPVLPFTLKFSYLYGDESIVDQTFQNAMSREELSIRKHQKGFYSRIYITVERHVLYEKK